MIALEGPRGNRTVHETITAFFEAIAQESNGDLQVILADDAVARFPNGVTQSALVSWVRRFGKADFTALSARLMYRELDVQTYREADLRVLRGRRHFELQPLPGEVLVIVPLQTRSAEGKRVLGTELQLVLKPENGELHIRESYEDIVLR